MTGGGDNGEANVSLRTSPGSAFPDLFLNGNRSPELLLNLLNGTLKPAAGPEKF